MVGSCFFWLTLISVFVVVPSFFFKRYFSVIRRMHPNVFLVGFVSFLMQVGATFVHSSSLQVMGGNVVAGGLAQKSDRTGGIFTESQFVIIKDLSESMSGIIKLFSGYISDLIPSQKPLLMLGYGTVPIFKFIFAFCTLSYCLPGYIFGIQTNVLLGGLYVFAHVADRVFNGARDAFRNQLMSRAINDDNKYIVFCVRKFIASLGSVLGAGITYYVMKYACCLDWLPPVILSSISKLYLLSVIPLFVAIGLLYFKLQDIKIVASSKKVGSISHWIYGLLAILVFPLLYDFAPEILIYLNDLFRYNIYQYVDLVVISVYLVSSLFNKVFLNVLSVVAGILLFIVTGRLDRAIYFFSVGMVYLLRRNANSVTSIIFSIFAMLWSTAELFQPSFWEYLVVLRQPMIIMGLIAFAYDIISKIKGEGVQWSKVLLFSVLSIFNANILIFYSYRKFSFKLPLIIGWIVGILCSTMLSLSISAISGLMVAFILGEIDYGYIKDVLDKHKSTNKPFYQLLMIGGIVSFARINDMIFISNFGKTGVFGDFFSPVIFGLLYVWISVSTLLQGIILERGYTKLLMSLIVFSLFLCNILLSFGLHINSFWISNLILMLLGFYSAGEESVLVTLLRQRIPNPSVFGMYFGIFDSFMAISKVVGILAINVIWLFFKESIVMAGRFCATMMIAGIISIFILNKFVFSSQKSIE